MNTKPKTVLFTVLLAAALLLTVLPTEAAALSKPSQAGALVLTGGGRDFRWPVPGQYGLSSCFLDCRSHYAIDISAPKGTEVVASYRGTVVEIYNGCTHNYGKSSSCCCGFGNYVIMEHSYALKSGEYITLYTRYAHLTKATVSVGDSLSAGQQVGTVGSTGYSTGHHLDFQILQGGYTPYKDYSIDPYINELLELPEGIWNALGSYCCGKYIEYIKDLYPRCTHESFNAQGLCAGCGFCFDWAATATTADMGNYTLLSQAAPAAVPYTAALGTAGQSLGAGTAVTVSGSVVNGAGETWYEISLSGGTAYLPKSALSFLSYLESQYAGQFTSLTEGQVLKPQSYTLSGKISSRYPITGLWAYLDGQLYATWSGSATEVSLAGTDINNKLYFSRLSPGAHTLSVAAQDCTGREPQTVLTVSFSMGALQVYTVTLDPGAGSCDVPSLSVSQGSGLGALPEASLLGHSFSGWYNAAGEAVAEGATIEESTVLTARYAPLSLTVTLGAEQISLPYGQTLAALPEPSRAGHRFLGWSTAESGGEPWPPETPVTEDMTLYPRFAPLSYTVTLDADGGALNFTAMSATYGVSYCNLPAPSRPGYRFAGWYLEDREITDSTAVFAQADHTLTARWEPLLEASDAPDRQPGAVISAVLCLLTGIASPVLLFLPVPGSKPEAAAAEAPPEETPAPE